ncbi:hypothetical protein SPRG_12385 [Saprolegnia parasitica CBS 223.65]|uniref:Cytochrome b5 heme-binding domain-containing protein n=1 Tax=Saprolegnia parasitica (strain CBS 223.65) TaxID=695850 RepID=A0A067BUD4_SAPPC|nr:hypothetical protein SPRG_12385 [Saprolegnia parasitica CBS 223.65]KDO21883.1 hypothetical protein SPRG_12385 [Saprolegnia parasitica CBS 223.65]|eukprot:XP_012207438.1 hypothetical protein SPRG_12385 [Saprolegnia parasitica CBS 223.65]
MASKSSPPKSMASDNQLDEASAVHSAISAVEIEDSHHDIQPMVANEQTLRKERKRCKSLELVYSDDEASTATSTVSLVTTPLSSTKKGTCVVQTRCTSYEKLCLCEVKQHRSASSCWLVANGIVYDVTDCILRKSGGVDCAQDMKFHSKAAQNCWSKCKIGMLQPCGDVPEANDSACAIM